LGEVEGTTAVRVPQTADKGVFLRIACFVRVNQHEREWLRSRRI